MPPGAPGPKRWLALLVVGLLTGALCAGVVALYVGTPSAPLGMTGALAMVLGLTAAAVLGVGLAQLLQRRRRKDR